MVWFFHILNCIKFITFEFLLLLINPEYSLELMLLKLKLQYLATCCKELTLWKIPWSWERVFLWKYPEGKRRREWQRMRCLKSITNNGLVFEQTLGVSGGQRSLACYRPWDHKSWTRLSNWTQMNSHIVNINRHKQKFLVILNNF